jgi:hypothetical protein
MSLDNPLPQPEHRHATSLQYLLLSAKTAKSFKGGGRNSSNNRAYRQSANQRPGVGRQARRNHTGLKPQSASKRNPRPLKRDAENSCTFRRNTQRTVSKLVEREELTLYKSSSDVTKIALEITTTGRLCLGIHPSGTLHPSPLGGTSSKDWANCFYPLLPTGGRNHMPLTIFEIRSLSWLKGKFQPLLANTFHLKPTNTDLLVKLGPARRLSKPHHQIV